jgi:hypothetical protein
VNRDEEQDWELWVNRLARSQLVTDDSNVGDPIDNIYTLIGCTVRPSVTVTKKAM